MLPLHWVPTLAAPTRPPKPLGRTRCIIHSDAQIIQNYCLRLVPPVGRRLELGLVRNTLASLFICLNVMQLMLLSLSYFI